MSADMTDPGKFVIDEHKDYESLIQLVKQVGSKIMMVPLDIITPRDTVGLTSEILSMCPEPMKALDLMDSMSNNSEIAAWLLACMFHYGYAKALYDHSNGDEISPLTEKA